MAFPPPNVKTKRSFRLNPGGLVVVWLVNHAKPPQDTRGSGVGHMKLLASIALLMLLVSPIVGIVALVFRVDVATWNTVTLLAAVALVILAICAGVYMVLRGLARLEDARALSTAAEGRRAHGWQPNAPTYNTTVNVLAMRNPETGDVQYLPPGDPARAGSMMRQYAMQGYQLEVEPR